MYNYTDVDDEIHMIGEKSRVMVKDKEVFLCCSLDEGKRVLVFSKDEEEPSFTKLEEMTFDFSDVHVSHIFEPKGKSERMDLLLSRVFNYSE